MTAPTDDGLRINNWYGMLDAELLVLRKRVAELEAANATLANSAPDWKWRPIETAPRDGTEVLLLFQRVWGEPTRVVGSWYALAKVPHWDVYGGDIAEKWVTHWMPLPAPPKGPA